MTFLLISCSGFKGAHVAPTAIHSEDPYLNAVGEDWVDDNKTAEEIDLESNGDDFKITT